MNGPWIRRIWERKGLSGKLCWFLLLPASCLYFVAVKIRGVFYARGWLKARKLTQPVISIGNLTIGGTGKTPSCLWLAQELGKRGLKVGIVSRGYGRTGARPVIFHAEALNIESRDAGADVSAAGDEPSMMARLYGATVAVAKSRYEAAQALLRSRNVDVFILDDGYQHRRLKRDVDLLLLGNDSRGWVLPSGPFREPRKSLRRADYYLVTAAEEKWKALMRSDRIERCFTGSLKPVSLITFESNRLKEHPLSLLYRSKILAVTGIANAEGFYRMIHDWEGEIVEAAEFADHHSYSSADWQRINRLARNADLIVTTEKDILKLVRFPFARQKLLALRVAMTVENGENLIQALMDRIYKKN